MNAIGELAGLAGLLRPAARLAEVRMAVNADIDAVIERLAGRVQLGSDARAPEDLQLDAVQRFWQVPVLTNLRDARLAAFGLGLPAGPTGRCLLQDGPRLRALLDGIDQWIDRPRWYRRCYQGLMRSYFNLDPEAFEERATRENWTRLRDYLARRAGCTVDPQSNPDWVKTLLAGRHLFGEAPCAPYVGALLQQRRDELDRLCLQLGIDGSSWFLKQLVGAQIAAATRLDDDAFVALLPGLLQALAGARSLRDAGLATLLERHAKLSGAPVHAGLRDAASHWWGSPTLAANAWRWNALGTATRDSVAQWLTADLLAGFFAAPGLDADGRRAAFWQRYVRSIRKVEFAAAPALLDEQAARGGEAADPRRGLVAPLRDAAAREQAMILTLGCAVVVVFADPLAPLQLHDLRRGQPFDTGRALAIECDADNALCQSRATPLSPCDGGDGWRAWEQRVEAALKDGFDIRPGAAAPTDVAGFIDLSDRAPAVAEAERPAIDRPRRPPGSTGEDVHWQTAEAASVPYSRPDLEVLARVHALRLDDLSAHGGKLWVRTAAADRRIARVLSRWGFVHVPGEGWSR